MLSALQENQPINRHVPWKKAVVLCLWWAVHVKACGYDQLCHLYPFVENVFLTNSAE